MDDVLQRDQNHVTVLGAVTDDSNRYIRPLLADPTTGRLLVSAVVAGTENGKLRVDGADTLYDYLANKVESLDGSIVFTVENPGGDEVLNMQVDTSSLTGIVPLANGGTGVDLTEPGANAIFGYDNTDSSAVFFALGAGLSYDHTTHTLSAPGSGSGYDLIQIATVPLTERHTLNFSDLFTGTDDSGNASTDIDIDVSNLANDNTFVTDIVANNTFTTDIANDSNFITELSNNNTFITDLTTNSTFISSVVTNITSSGGGLVQSVTGLNTDNTDPANPVVEISVDGTTITGDGTPGSPLTAMSSGGITSINSDTTAAQTITAGAGITVNDLGGGAHQIVNTGGSSLIATGGTPATITTLTTIISQTLAGGVLGTGNAVKIKVFYSNVSAGGGGSVGFLFSYGGSATVNVGFSTTSVDSIATSGMAEFVIIATGATNSQLIAGSCYAVPPGFDNNDQARGGATAVAIAVDSTISETIELQVYPSSGSSIKILGFIVESVA